MTIDEPDAKAEVEAQFADYERALIANDVEALDRFFLPSDAAIRYGVGENLYGYGAIKAFRAARSPAGLSRRLEKTRIVTYGRDCAIAATLFRRDNAPGKIGAANADLGPFSRRLADRRRPHQHHRRHGLMTDPLSGVVLLPTDGAPAGPAVDIAIDGGRIASMSPSAACPAAPTPRDARARQRA